MTIVHIEKKDENTGIETRKMCFVYYFFSKNHIDLHEPPRGKSDYHLHVVEL